ncbi:hypothetical protein MSPP1_002171 [Malassezia sp. CBS 17886]|nr:hypothetical protein MSPP1_002171 [Malassezia sp. CBS 17886]
MYKILVLAATAASVAVAASTNQLSVKGYTADVSNKDTGCKFGSGDILKACGKCAKSITECATSGLNATSVCVEEINSFAEDCGGCAVDILECL